MTIIAGIFLVLHGVVHLIFVGQSARLFELRPGMVWPDDSWVLSKIASQAAIRGLANVALVLAAIGFIAGGVGLIANQDWWSPVTAVSAAFSIILYVLFWDGTRRQLPDQGAFALLINLLILAVLFVV